MTTIQDVFDQTIHLMDEQSEVNGAVLTYDTNEYRFRTISILNTVIPSLYPYSDNYSTTDQGRPAPPALLVPDFENPDFTQEIPLDDSLARGVLPYALAAHLLAGENVQLSMFFDTKYAQAYMDLRAKLPASFEPIPTPYGLF